MIAQKATDKELYKVLAKTNDYAFIHTKAAEELTELAAELLKQVNKGTKDHTDSICAEIADVKVRLGILEEFYSKKTVKKYINRKIENAKKHLQNGRFKNKV